jgi:hypothetical protein
MAFDGLVCSISNGVPVSFTTHVFTEDGADHPWTYMMVSSGPAAPAAGARANQVTHLSAGG